MSVSSLRRDSWWLVASRRRQSTILASGERLAATPAFNRSLSGVAVCGPLALVLTTMVLETINSNYNRVGDTISSLVWGPFGPAQTVAFILFGIAVLAIAFRLARALAGTRWTVMGQLAMALIGIAFIIIAIFPTSAEPHAADIQGLIHKQTARSIAAIFPVACAFIGKAMSRHLEHKAIAQYSKAAALVGAFLLPAGALASFTDASWLGAIERVMLANGVLWIEVTGIYFFLDSRNPRQLQAHREEYAPGLAYAPSTVVTTRTERRD